MAKGDFYDFTDNDLMWMKVALTVASRAEIPEYAKGKPSVGCVIRRSRSNGPPAVLAVGWNGFPPNTSDDVLKDKAAGYDRENKTHGLTNELGLHAEINALRNCSENREKATVYVTHVPCHSCAKQLVSHRVKRVFYLFWMDQSESSIKLFRDFDISCIPLTGKSRDDVLRDFSETFLENHSISAGSTKKDIPDKDSWYLNTEDLKSRTYSDMNRAVSAEYPLNILVEEHGNEFDKIKQEIRELGDKVDKIVQEFHEYRNQHNTKNSQEMTEGASSSQ